MTNLEWIRTLSAKELSDLLYDYWLPRGQYVWTDSRKGLTKMLGENYLERDCNKCKHQGNCYCVKGLGCPYEPKTESSNSEKSNNCTNCECTDDCTECREAKHGCKDDPKPCEWCKFYDGENCYSQEPCKAMLYFKTEPQTERSE